MPYIMASYNFQEHFFSVWIVCGYRESVMNVHIYCFEKLLLTKIKTRRNVAPMYSVHTCCNNTHSDCSFSRERMNRQLGMRNCR